MSSLIAHSSSTADAPRTPRRLTTAQPEASAEFTSTIADAIRSIVVDTDQSAAVARVIVACLKEVAGAEFGGITELSKAGLRTRAASDPRVAQLDRAQRAANDGPVLALLDDTVRVVQSGALSVDRRWPRFGPIAARLGVNSVLCVALLDGGALMGSLTLYSRANHAFDLAANDIAGVLAAHAAVVLTASRQQANLSIALQSRDAIGQAKGILMERYKLSDQQAFDTLVTVSQRTHSKLRDVADELRTTGTLPGLS